MARIDKLTKLIAVFDQFHSAIEALDNPVAARLSASWTGIRSNYLAPTEAPRSAYAAGMEQGLRETPLLLGSMPHPRGRWQPKPWQGRLQRITPSSF
ncbi:MAG: hypothetical protein HY020_13385 [Burkholderiales bacterium]|nr:hypothetical protein [Burkholderiales bacterium]